MKLRWHQILLHNFFAFWLNKYSLVLLTSIWNVIKITFQLCCFLKKCDLSSPNSLLLLGSYYTYACLVSEDLLETVFSNSMRVNQLHFQIDTSLTFLCNNSHLEDSLKISVQQPLVINSMLLFKIFLCLKENNYTTIKLPVCVDCFLLCGWISSHYLFLFPVCIVIRRCISWGNAPFLILLIHYPNTWVLVQNQEF